MSEKKARVSMDIHLGSEPSFTGMIEVSRIDITNALNWYNNNRSRKESAEWFIKKYPDISAAAVDIIGNAGFLVRMISRGLPVDEQVTKRIEDAYAKALEFTKKHKSKPKEEVQEKPKKKEVDPVVDSYLELVDYAIDDVLRKGKADAPAPIAFKPAQKKEVVQWVKANIKRYEDSKTYEETGFSGIRQINALIKLMNDVLTVIDKNTPATPRKARAKKAVIPEKVVLHFKGKTAEGLKLTKILGAKAALIYDDKSRRIMFVEGTSEGLYVKGSSLINIATNSFGKTLRKPDEQLAKIKGMPMRGTEKAIKDIPGKAHEVKGRSAESWTILAIF